MIVKRESGKLCGTKIDSLSGANDAATQSVIRAFDIIQGHKVTLRDEMQVAQINGQSLRAPVMAMLSPARLTSHPRISHTVGRLGLWHLRTHDRIPTRRYGARPWQSARRLWVHHARGGRRLPHKPSSVAVQMGRHTDGHRAIQIVGPSRGTDRQDAKVK